MKKPKILIVDDNTKILYAFRTFLENEGYVSIAAERGKDVMDILSQVKPKVVFLDIRLPDQDGLDILRQIKEKYPSLAVVVLSGHNNEENINRARDLGAIDFLKKPLTLSKLRTILNHLDTISDDLNTQ